ncbi:MAG: hypothetical protein WCL08_08385 [Verrucomicrobiota bacterium]
MKAIIRLPHLQVIRFVAFRAPNVHQNKLSLSPGDWVTKSLLIVVLMVTSVMDMIKVRGLEKPTHKSLKAQRMSVYC